MEEVHQQYPAEYESRRLAGGLLDSHFSPAISSLTVFLKTCFKTVIGGCTHHLKDVWA